MSRFYDAMKRAFDDEADVNPELAVEQLPSERTDPEIELEQLEAEIAAANVPSREALPAPIPIRPIEEVPTAPVVREAKPIEPSYERIIQRLLTFRGGRRHCVILVAGAVPGEGASTVARDLAMALGQGQYGPVVLVDGNLRQPCQQNAFEIDEIEGFADVLKDGAELKSTLRHVPNAGLSVLCAGDIKDGGAPQFLTAAAVQRVTTALYSQFDWVILDGPPVTTYPDSSSLATVADGAVLVLRAERTRWEVAEEAKRILDQAGVSILGGVLNRRKYHIPGFIYRHL